MFTYQRHIQKQNYLNAQQHQNRKDHLGTNLSLLGPNFGPPSFFFFFFVVVVVEVSALPVISAILMKTNVQI